MEVLKQCMMPFQGQMSVGEFRADASEFQVGSVPSCEDESEIWHFLAQCGPLSFDFRDHPAHGAAEQCAAGVASHRSRLTQRRGDCAQVGLRQMGRPLCHGRQAHLESR